MKNSIKLYVLALIFFSIASTAQAATPDELCQARKNVEVAKFVSCRHRALSGLPTSNFKLPSSNCLRTFFRKWSRIEKRLNKVSQCLEAPIQVSSFRSTIASQIGDITSLIGRNKKGKAPKRKCRILKILAAGKYVACRHRAESGLARTSDTEVYENHISRCNAKFKDRWQKIISRTESLGAQCFDDELTVDDYISAISTNTDKIAKVLAGQDELGLISISVNGSPLALTQSGASSDLTITNNSTKATAFTITADFSGTALDSNVELTGNTCASVAPGASCILTFTPGNSIIPQTNFTIQGSNTESVVASIQVVAPDVATISVTGSPLTLTANGATGNLTITNTSSINALNIASDFTSTALDGNVVETGNTCANVAPAASCILTFTPGNSLVPLTNFSVSGTNTVTLMPSITIESGSTLATINSTSGSASGGTGVTLTGTGLTGATAVTFDGIPATSVNVVNSTTVTAVTPAHAAGVVDVVIDTPAGGATLSNAYTYIATAIGQSSSGGTIACLNGGLNNLISATADNSASIEWGGFGTVTGAQSNTDGASNTTTIVNTLGNNGGTPYASQLCNEYEVDSQGNTPCEAGNTCYNDWFLPAGDNVMVSGQIYCLYTNRTTIGGFANDFYWSSTELPFDPNFFSYLTNFSDGNQTITLKSFIGRVRCVRSFVP